MSKKRTKMLTVDQERQLLNAYHDNNDIQARNLLIESYMPLATRAAEAFARKGTAQLSDLVQEASLALAQAIDNFKRDKDARISTLAPYYIKAALMKHAMDYHGVVRIGTNLPDKKVFMNLRKMVAEIQAHNGGLPITDADRETIAKRLKVKIENVKRMEPRVFSSDIAVSHTDVVSEDEDQTVTSAGIIAVEGGQAAVEVEMDQREIMSRIASIVRANFEDRDLDIVQARLSGDMTREKFDALVNKHGISVERIRQIQRAALMTIRENLQREGISGFDVIAC
jgi:RNA polymerase sigma factor (sigma-70 family)